MQLDVTINMLSRWHAGTGAGGGTEVDSVVRRERGRPVLAGTTLKGLARDRAQLVAAAFPRHASLVDAVFGSKRRPGTWHFGTGRSVATGTDDLAAIEISRHNRHDRESGRVPDDFYFSLEAVAPLTLHAVVEPVWHEPGELEVAFVGASLMAIDRLGARRQRGWGRCEVMVSAGSRPAEEVIEPLFRRLEVAE